MVKNREFVSKQAYNSAALGEVFQRAQGRLGSFKPGRLTQYLSFSSSDGTLPLLAPAPAIKQIYSFNFHSILASSPDLPGQLAAIIQMAQKHFARAVRCRLACHQPGTPLKKDDITWYSFSTRTLRASGIVVAHQWDKGEAILRYSPDDVRRFAAAAKVSSPDDPQAQPKLYAEAFRRVRACAAPLKVVSAKGSVRFKPIGRLKCGYKSSGSGGGYGGPDDLYWQVDGLSPQEQVDLLERALIANGCPHRRVWVVNVEGWLGSPVRNYHSLYNLIRSAGWPLGKTEGGFGLELGGPQYLDAILPLLKPGKVHRNPTAGRFHLPAQAARGKPRSANLCVLSSKQGHRLSVRLADDLAKYLPEIEKALGISFQR
jgi:hypothetical protein